MERCWKVYRLARQRDAKIRRVGRAIDPDLIQHALVVPFRRQDSGDSQKNAQVSLLKSVLARYGSLARIVGVPGTERSRGNDFSGRRGGGESGVKLQRAVGTRGIQTQLLEIKFERIFSRLCSHDFELGIFGEYFVEADLVEFAHGIVRAISAATVLFARRNRDLKSVQMNEGNPARVANEAQD